jgi:hypothetical protein
MFVSRVLCAGLAPRRALCHEDPERLKLRFRRRQGGLGLLGAGHVNAPRRADVFGLRFEGADAGFVAPDALLLIWVVIHRRMAVIIAHHRASLPPL